MITVKALKTIKLKGVTPKSTNNLFYPLFDEETGKLKTWKKKPAYKLWRKLLLDILPNNFLPKDMSKNGLFIKVGIMKELDLDNTLKGIIDALQDKYHFNDNEIQFLKAKKVITGYYDTHDYSKDYIEITLLEPISINYENTKNVQLEEFEAEEFRLHTGKDWYPGIKKNKNK